MMSSIATVLIEECHFSLLSVTIYHHELSLSNIVMDAASLELMITLHHTYSVMGNYNINVLTCHCC